MNALIFIFLMFLLCVTVPTTNLTESQWEELEEQDEKLHQQWAENNYD
jgi:Na+-transporting methylmalonyl-CoA/oxaloacetate decarboxylase gamma subunit